MARTLDIAKKSLWSSSRRGWSVVFPGFAHTDPCTGNIAYRAFRFGALKPATHAATVDHLDQLQAGRIDVTCEAIVRTGKNPSTHTVMSTGQLMQPTRSCQRVRCFAWGCGQQLLQITTF
jgi:hypothetical protein